MISTFQTCEVHQDDSREQLAVMIGQEEKFYRCKDFLQLQGKEIDSHTLLHVVQECAMLVTDAPLAVLSGSQSSVTNHQHSINSLVRSPVLVTSFPPPPHGTEGSGACAQFPSTCAPSMDNTIETPLCRTEAERMIAWRRQMLDWAYNFSAIYDLDREIVASAFHILDRYIASEVLSVDTNYADTPLDREDVQLYAMVCLYITIKAFVPYRKLTMECIIEMSKGFYTKEHIGEAELEVLTALDWHVNQPTVMDYCRLYLKLCPNFINKDIILYTCEHFAELALYDVYFIPMPTSCVALAVVLLTCQQLGVSSLETERFIASLHGLVNLKTVEFDTLYSRLESLC